MLIPVSFAITLASWVIAPIAVLLAGSDGCLPKSGFDGQAQRLPIWMGTATTGAGGRADDYPCGLNKGSKGHYGQPRLIDHVRKEITAQSADEGNGGGDRRLWWI